MKEIKVFSEDPKLFNMTQSESVAIIDWAIAQFGLVCGLSFVKGSAHDYDLIIKGRRSNAAGGWANKRRAELSTLRNMSGRKHFIAGGILLHELAHTHAKFNAPRWRHVMEMGHPDVHTAYRDYLMHPGGSITDWFSPAEVFNLQKAHGLPEKNFWPHPITYLGSEMRERNRLIRNLRATRDNTTDVSIRNRVHAHMLRQRELYFRDRDEWYRRIGDWNRATMRANVPGIRRIKTPNIGVKAAMAENTSESLKNYYGILSEFDAKARHSWHETKVCGCPECEIGEDGG